MCCGNNKLKPIKVLPKNDKAVPLTVRNKQAVKIKARNEKEKYRL
jgi:hypothetical protein